MKLDKFFKNDCGTTIVRAYIELSEHGEKMHIYIKGSMGITYSSEKGVPAVRPMELPRRHASFASLEQVSMGFL